MRVVVLAVGPRTLEADLWVHLHERHKVAVHEFLAVVVMERQYLEREALDEGFHGVQHFFRTLVPHGVDLGPLRLAVCQRDDPEEAAVHVAAAKCDCVNLQVPRLGLGGDRLLARTAGEVGRGVVLSGTAVLADGPRPPALEAPERPVHRRGAH